MKKISAVVLGLVGVLLCGVGSAAVTTPQCQYVVKQSSMAWDELQAKVLQICVGANINLQKNSTRVSFSGKDTLQKNVLFYSDIILGATNAKAVSSYVNALNEGGKYVCPAVKFKATIKAVDSSSKNCVLTYSILGTTISNPDQLTTVSIEFPRDFQKE